MVEILAISISLLLLIVLGLREKKNNDINIGKIPIRVNVNGIRGKSTITRLIAAILTEAGYKTVGKTTGTAPRVIYDGKEEEIFRDASGVNIREQLKVIQSSKDYGADALVLECMAVNPDYQKIYQEKMVQANIGVIVNIREDHLDEMGPTTDEIALAFSTTVPYDGILIIPDTEYNDYFTEIAQERNTKIFIADEEEIPKGYLDKFNYVVFPNNISIPLALAKALDIDKKTALKGMLKAEADPGALRITTIQVDGKESIFVNAMAANDPLSTLDIWQMLEDDNLIQARPIVLFNARQDRVDRTIQMTKECIPYLGSDIDLILMGQVVEPIKVAYEKGKLKNINQLIDLSNQSGKEVRDHIYKIMDGRLVFSMGNVHGIGEEFFEAISIWDERLNTLKL